MRIFTLSKHPLGFSPRSLFVCALFLLAQFGLKSNLLASTYCTPTISYTNLHLVLITFNDPITYSSNPATSNAKQYLTGNDGYSQTMGASSGSYKQFGNYGFFYGASNPSASPKTYYINGYADWNNDGDFDDEHENFYSHSDVIPGVSTQTTGGSILPDLASFVGTIRVRFTISETNTTACGTVSEAEDYYVTISPNTAPILNNGSTPFLNPIKDTDTDNNGWLVNELVNSTAPDLTLINDIDDGTTSYSLVPRGIAIYNQSTTNGTWQFKTGLGSWTNFGTLNSTNALILLANSPRADYQSNTRIRFVPTNTGTPSFDFYAWDGTMGKTGTFANTTLRGGATSFSSANETVALNVVSNSDYDGSKIFTINNNASNKILASDFNRSSGTVNNPSLLLSGDTHYQGFDVAYNKPNNRVYWTNAANYTDIEYCNSDGTGYTNIPNVDPNGVSGMAVSSNKLYTVGWSGLQSANLDGTALTSLCGGIGQLDIADIGDIGDVEYFNNKLYLIYYSNNDLSYQIVQTNTDGSAKTTMYTTQNYLKGLFVDNDTIYWTENNTSTVPYVGSVNKKAISLGSGGSPTTVNTQIGSTYNDLMVDGSYGYIYVIDNVPANGDFTGLLRMTLGGSMVSRVTNFDCFVNSIVFDNSPVASPPSVTSVNLPADATYAANDNMDFTINFSTPVTVVTTNGTPEIGMTLNTGGVVQATYLSGSGTASLLFRYTVATGKSDNDGITLAGSINTNSGTMKDGLGNNAVLTLNGVSSTAGILIESVITNSSAPLATTHSTLYPNPAKDIINLQTPISGELYITNLDGQLVLSQKVSVGQNIIDIRGLQSGTFPVKFISSTTSETFKLIVK